MNYEQKYKEALARAKDMMSYKKVRREDMEYLFPELKESEDERVKREIIEYLKNGTYTYHKDWIAWLEKQGEQSSNILWHDVNEEPEEYRQIFCEWKSSTDIWYAVVFYRANTKAFWEGERIVKNVLKWTYVDEILEKQDKQKSIWHNENEEPQKDSLILLIMQSGIPVVAKIIEPHHTFTHGERWAYIDDLLKK
jgi:hypothetical protein